MIRFSGDSGDGMQLTGTLFSDTSALLGNGISTFPDYPAEIRAPPGTVAGVSGFQVHFGAKRHLNPGDFCDVLDVYKRQTVRKSNCLHGLLLKPYSVFATKRIPTFRHYKRL